MFVGTVPSFRVTTILTLLDCAFSPKIIPIRNVNRSPVFLIENFIEVSFELKTAKVRNYLRVRDV